MLTLVLALAVVEPLPVPADSLAVVQVRGLGHVRTQLRELATAVAPHKAAGFAAELDGLLKPDGRDLFALDITRRGFVAVLPTADGVTWAAYLPTTDYTRFRAKVLTVEERVAFRGGGGFDTTEFAGRPLYLLDRTRDGYLIATGHEPTARRLAGDPKPLLLDGADEATEVFLGSDVGLFVNLPAVQARYGGLLTGTRYALPALLRGGAFGLPKLDARQAAQVTAVADGVIQTVADGRGFAVGVNLGPAGVTAETALSIRPNTLSARVLAGERPHRLPLLDTLPGGQSAYAAGRFGVELSKRLRTAFPEASPADPLATWAAHGWATAGHAPGPVLEVCQPERPENWLDRMRTWYERAEIAQNIPLRGKTDWVRQSVVHQGRVFDRLGFTFDLTAATAGFPDEGVRQAAHVTMKGLVGERVEQWLAVDGPNGLRVSAADWPAARLLVDAFLGGGNRAGEDPQVKAIRRQLPAEASAVVLLDAARLTCQVGGLAHGALNELPAFPGLELPVFVPPSGRSPFLGLAVVTRPTGGRAVLVLPADALRASLATVQQTP